MNWSTANFKDLALMHTHPMLRIDLLNAIQNAVSVELQRIADQTLYTMQHDGRKIYLEKVLNEHFEVAGYLPTNHELTKKIYIQDSIAQDKVFIWQNNEFGETYLEDDEVVSEEDVFLDSSDELAGQASFIVFVPEQMQVNHAQLKAVLDQYRYAGKLFIINTY